MIPAADQSLPDTHIPVADPEDLQEPSVAPGLSSFSKASASAALNPFSNQAAYSKAVSDGTSTEHNIQSSAGPGKRDTQVSQSQPILLDVQKECFSRMLLLPEMITDHLPETYLAAVQQL